MRNDLIKIFGSQLRWFGGLSKKHQLYVLYFVLSFILLFITSNSPVLLLAIVLNFGNSARLLRLVSGDELED